MGEEALAGGRMGIATPKFGSQQLQSKANAHYPPSSDGNSSEEQPPTATHQVREAKAPEHSQGAPRTATVADDVKSLCPFGRRDEGHTCSTQQTAKQPSNGVVPWIVPARRTKRAMKGI